MVDLVIALSSGILGSLVNFLVPKGKEGLRRLIVLLVTLTAMVFSWRLALNIFAGQSFKLKANLVGLSLSLNPDSLGALFAIIASTLWLFTAVYSFGYMEKKKNLRSFYSFFLLSLTTTLGVAFSGNLIALYLFYELLTFATYPLVTHERTPEAWQAGKKYLLYSLSGAGLLLLAIVLTYAFSGQLDFSSTALLASCTSSGLNWLLFLFIAGFGVKAAIMPLHHWLPAAMVAPTPVSALLHAVAVVYSGVYGILRIIYSVFGTELLRNLSFASFLPWLAAITILLGGFMATQQDVLKRRLAYNTISELSYILLGAFTLEKLGFTGALLHMVAYSILKITLFFCAGIISEQTGFTKISQLEGVGWALPKTMTAFGIVSLGMIGMLPLNTFWSKYYLMLGGLAADKWPLALVLIISGLINAICYLPIVIKAFKASSRRPYLEEGRSLALMLSPALILTLAAIVFGLFPSLLWPSVQKIVSALF